MTDSKRAYTRILNIIDLNTGGPQPETIDADHIELHLSNTNVDRAQGLKALRRAVTDGRVEQTEDGYRLTDDGEDYLHEQRH